MMTKVPYLLHARADEDLRSGPLTATDTRQDLVPTAKRHNLRIRGISESNARKWAGSSKGYWRVAGSKVLQVSLPNSYWDRLGLKTLSQTWQRLNRTA
jgi:hypothetical protein